jgi:hypothetical protein
MSFAPADCIARSMLFSMASLNSGFTEASARTVAESWLSPDPVTARPDAASGLN